MLVAQIADLLATHGEYAVAYAVYAKLLAEPELPKVQRIRFLEQGAAIARAAGEIRQATQWTTQAQQLKEPAPK